MLKASTIFLQAITFCIGVAIFAFLLWEPHLEGRNVHATLFQIYFNDPFLVFVYVASIPFFVVLSRVFMLLGYARQNKFFSDVAVKALQTIQRCAVLTIGFALVGEVYIVLSQSDDRAGGIFMGLLVVFGALVTAASATVLKHLLYIRNNGRPLS